MSQGFRKNNKPIEFTDTTGVSPMQRGDEQRVARRTQQITHLHQQFQDLKKKIREVQNKNQKIIEKIHRAYNFKKKNAYTEQYLPDTSPVIHYDNRMQVYSGANMSIQSRSEKNSQQDFRLQKKVSDITSQKKNKRNQNMKINYSVQYGKNDQFIEDSDSNSVQNYYQKNSYYPSAQMPPKAPSYHQSRPSSKLVSKQPQRSITPSQAEKKTPPHRYSQYSQNVDEAAVDQYYEQQIKSLQIQLQQKQGQVYRLSAMEQKFKNEKKNFYTIVQDRVQQFFESIVLGKMQQIEKAHRKFQYKIKNLKKATLLAKDRKQDKRSTQLISQGKRMRNNSRSRSKSRANSPRRNLSTRNIIDRELDTSRRSQNSQSHSKLNAEQREQKSKQFQQIAQKYEQMIQIKNQEIQKIQNKYKNKQRECYQLKMRVDLLQKKLDEQQQKLSNANQDNGVGSFGELPHALKKASIQTNLLQNLLESDTNTVTDLTQKMQQLQKRLSEKDTRLSDLIQKLKKNQQKIRQIHKEYQQSQQKLKTKHKSQITTLQQNLQSSQKENQIKLEQIRQLKNSLSSKDKQMMEKQCDFLNKQNKLKKMQLTIQNKNKKIQQLQKLITNNNSNPNSALNSSRQCWDSSRNYEETSSVYNDAIKQLKQQVSSLQQKLDAHKNQVFSLSKTKDFYIKRNQQLEGEINSIRKQNQLLQIENEQLRTNININNISAVQSDNRSSSQFSQKNKTQQQNDEPINSKYSQHKIKQLTEQKQQWFQKYQQIKNSLLQKDSKLIKINTQLTYTKKNINISEQKLDKIKKQLQQLKIQNKRLATQLTQKENQLELQKETNQQKISQLEKQFVEFQDQFRKNNDEDILGNSQYKSEKSISMFSYANSKIGSNHKQQYLQTQIQLLTVKLKQAQAEIQTQKMMEDKIMNQYRQSIEESKKHLRQKINQLTTSKQENNQMCSKIQQLNLQIRTLHQQLQVTTTKDNANSLPNSTRKYTQLIDRIQQLQHELKQTKQINAKLTEVETQLFQQITTKQQERVELYEQLQSKDIKISQLEELINTIKDDHRKQDYKGSNHNAHSSHVSSTSNKRDSIKSQSSLKYSAYSNNNNSKFMTNSNKYINDQKVDFQLSEAGSQFYDIDQVPQYQYNEQSSQLSNISELFMREDPFQKMRKTKIKRTDQLKLFQKTSSYIKSLKNAISEKEKRIKLLEKKIESLKSSQLVRKELGYSPDDSNLQKLLFSRHQNQEMDGDTFKDYESVQLENRRAGNVSLRRYKQIQHDMKLVMQENIMYTYRIQALQQDILKAEQQQNSLVKIKDLYKEQIKKLIKKNQQTTQKFQQQIKREKKRVEQSQSVHNLQAIKQLFIKIIQTIASKFTQDTGSFSNARKKQQKRKQIEEYVKVMSNILKLQKKTKDGLLTLLHQSR